MTDLYSFSFRGHDGQYPVVVFFMEFYIFYVVKNIQQVSLPGKRKDNEEELRGTERNIHRLFSRMIPPMSYLNSVGVAGLSKNFQQSGI